MTLMRHQGNLLAADVVALLSAVSTMVKTITLPHQRAKASSTSFAPLIVPVTCTQPPLLINTGNTMALLRRKSSLPASSTSSETHMAQDALNFHRNLMAITLFSMVSSKGLSQAFTLSRFMRKETFPMAANQSVMSTIHSAHTVVTPTRISWSAVSVTSNRSKAASIQTLNIRTEMPLFNSAALSPLLDALLSSMKERMTTMRPNTPREKLVKAESAQEKASASAAALLASQRARSLRLSTEDRR